MAFRLVEEEQAAPAQEAPSSRPSPSGLIAACIAAAVAYFLLAPDDKFVMPSPATKVVRHPAKSEEPSHASPSSEGGKAEQEAPPVATKDTEPQAATRVTSTGPVAERDRSAAPPASAPVTPAPLAREARESERGAEELAALGVTSATDDAPVPHARESDHGADDLAALGVTSAPEDPPARLAAAGLASPPALPPQEALPTARPEPAKVAAVAKRVASRRPMSFGPLPLPSRKLSDAPKEPIVIERFGDRTPMRFYPAGHPANRVPVPDVSITFSDSDPPSRRSKLRTRLVRTGHQRHRAARTVHEQGRSDDADSRCDDGRVSQ